MSVPSTPMNPNRRRLLRALAASSLATALGPLLPAYARAAAHGTNGAASVPGGAARDVSLDIAIRRETLDIAGGRAAAVSLNHSVPGPLIELWEGQQALLRVTNHLQEDSSLHWHGLLLPFEFDGVPGVTFPGIAPGATWEVRFPVRQSGTYWYHSHSGLQEQQGAYGPLIIHPHEPKPHDYQRDYVLVLSDWTFEDPDRVLARLKKLSHYYNRNRRTVGDFLRDVESRGLGATVRERSAWGAMRMTPTDIADVSGATYTYLMNGLHPQANWTGLFRPGERVRLRVINASAMTYFNVRIPGLPMTVIQADGQNVAPVETDEFQIAIAETLDVVVAPDADRAYTIMAESMDRSGYARGTLAPRPDMSAPVPPLRPPPRRTMADMGMDHRGMDHAGMDHKGMPDMADHGGHQMAVQASPVVCHGPDHHGAGNSGVAEIQRSRVDEPGTGLDEVDHRVLTYAQLRNVHAMRDRRVPARTYELHLTGNMERYMWSFDGKAFHEVDSPIDFPYGERVRLILVNDTMMEHPIHLHGIFMELENGQGEHLPFKHTVSVKPAERLSLLITADEPGRWAFHCHLLYHMEMGMFRVVRVRPEAIST
ncbi:MAG: copper resistance system multicopper oxidase [Pseudomonadales bacterium]